MKKIARALLPLFLSLTLICWHSSLAVADSFMMTPDGVRLFFEHVEVKPEVEKGTIVFLHGWGMSYAEWADVEKNFKEDGWSTLSFDFRGHGASVEAHDKQLDYQEMESPFQRAKLFVDLQTVMGYLFTDKPIWLIGSSVGANYALSYAAKDKRVHGVVLLAPGYDDFGVLQRGQTIQQYGARPILLIAARNNPWSFRTCLELKEQAMGTKAFYGVQSGHEMNGFKDKKPFLNVILQWMNAQTPGAADIESHFDPESVSTPIDISIQQI